MLILDIKKKVDKPLSSAIDKKILIISSSPLGDCLMSLTLFHNLMINGVDGYFAHERAGVLKDLFPLLKKRGIEALDHSENLYNEYDQIILFFDSRSIQKELLKLEREKGENKVFCLIPTLRKPHKNSCVRFDSKLTIIENLMLFSQKFWGLKKIVKDNGIVIRKKLEYRSKKKQVIIHPFAGQEKKHWPGQKFLQLSHSLKEDGFEPLIVFSKEELEKGKDFFNGLSCITPDLLELSEILYESGFLIGNDSGIGHLASCLKIPTLTICWNRKMSTLWRPSWYYGKIIKPSALIPNIGRFKFRQKAWTKLISVNKAKKTFSSMQKACL